MDLSQLEHQALDALNRVTSIADLESIHHRFLGRKDGELTKILRQLANLSAEEKKKFGQQANSLRGLIENKINEIKTTLSKQAQLSQLEQDRIDVTLPGNVIRVGSAHPILSAIQEISSIFHQLGFDSVSGPEMETDDNNFNALNIPLHHPARDLHDTFYLKTNPPLLLRTHTSPVQIRLMRAVRPPVRIISVGRVYRHEAIDATHAAIFHQVEGLAVADGITLADLKGTLTHFAKGYFGKNQSVRFRPSYFPFVEPGAEMDLQCFVCEGSKTNKEGLPCGLCKASGWIEILGAGVVHPQVLRNVGYDPNSVSGFAFGIGVERLVMARLGLRDIRMFLESDMRFLEQFS